MPARSDTRYAADRGPVRPTFGANFNIHFHPRIKRVVDWRQCASSRRDVMRETGVEIVFLVRALKQDLLPRLPQRHNEPDGTNDHAEDNEYDDGGAQPGGFVRGRV